ncbi:MarR family winged helix-turn-helix transcriptional regulator [Allobranchiibius sp. GilTou73]|uniref:MarR family winged helix-turn-helix transcriptional regulator n=1 Tax=Allobranchiibius sp. GilTou73 TaxID=2904523 RepID=UPI001F47BA76|nr:MarR family winged helix-turn-helix transcriptional regulator [Allobranchiibius sp. GilTou73]UIJ34563.1 MarR family winged helix-turn-helix transcriptional regulator [Allobranchiibius sp. GilTou73]
MTTTDWEIATATLRVTTQLVDGIQEGLAARGFDDVRPAHGFAFATLSRTPTNQAGIAAALNISKQAAAQLVEHLVGAGYVSRHADPADGRSQLLRLTARGRACTRAAEESAAQVVAGWRDALSPEAYAGFATAVRAVAEPGGLRPAW